MWCFRAVLLISVLIFITFQLRESEGCKALTKPCFHHNDCCSHHCFKQLKWPTGVCKPGGGHHYQPGNHGMKCKSVRDTCKSNHECCSKFCAKKVNHLIGVCQPGLHHPGGKNSGL